LQHFRFRKLALILCAVAVLATFSMLVTGCGSAGSSTASNVHPSPSPTPNPTPGPTPSPTPTPAPGSHSVSLSWNASSSTVVGYNVYRGTQTGGPYNRVNSSPDGNTTFLDSNVQAGATYFYVVTAVDANSQESGFSNETSAVVP
jgi:hypothetical protein